MDFTDGVLYRFSCQNGTAAEKIESTVSQKEIFQRLRYAKKFLKSNEYNVFYIYKPHFFLLAKKN